MTNTTNNNDGYNNLQVILGIDVGTSGIRGCIVERPVQHEHEKVITEFKVPMTMPEETDCGIRQSPDIWLAALNELLQGLQEKYDLCQITHIIVDATSSTVLLTDLQGTPLTDALMYNDSLSIEQAKVVHDNHLKTGGFSGATGASSTLAKVLRLVDENPELNSAVICHQVDHINHYLCGTVNVTDENNALKLGFDSINQAWPIWVEELINTKNRAITLPKVVTPGSLIGTVTDNLINRFGFQPNVQILAGTTDSIAGFLASGASKPGDAVSSLGSTLAIKAISDSPIFKPELGLYSHRLGDYWLVGGASNSGGRVLAQLYSNDELKTINQSIDTNRIADFFTQTSEQFYPLLSCGERFPIADADFEPSMPLSPKCKKTHLMVEPDCLHEHQSYFLQVSLGLAQVEQLAYRKLMEFGVEPLSNIYAVGGGTKNQAWMFFRDQLLPAKLKPAQQLDAAYGVTKLVK